MASARVRTWTGRLTGVLLAVAVGMSPASGQELEPRAYSPSPTGTTFLATTATRSTGDVLLDPAVPLTDVSARIGVFAVGAGHVFNVMGRSTLLLGAVPFAWCTAEGQIGEDRREATRRGLGDARVKVSMILAGFRAMKLPEFAKAPRRTIAGASLTVVPPTGQYDPVKLVNLGSHRWSFKPEAGVSIPYRRWTFDAYGGVWLFSDNTDYYPGTADRHQGPVLAAQTHVSYTLWRRAWLAANATWYSGGQVVVNGGPSGAPYSNSRLGATFALPLGRTQSLKFAYSTGAATRTGADFRIFTAGWQMLFF